VKKLVKFVASAKMAGVRDQDRKILKLLSSAPSLGVRFVPDAFVSFF